MHWLKEIAQNREIPIHAGCRLGLLKAVKPYPMAKIISATWKQSGISFYAYQLYCVDNNNMIETKEK